MSKIEMAVEFIFGAAVELELPAIDCNVRDSARLPTCVERIEYFHRAAVYRQIACPVASYPYATSFLVAFTVAVSPHADQSRFVGERADSLEPAPRQNPVAGLGHRGVSIGACAHAGDGFRLESAVEHVVASAESRVASALGAGTRCIGQIRDGAVFVREILIVAAGRNGVVRPVRGGAYIARSLLRAESALPVLIRRRIRRVRRANGHEEKTKCFPPPPPGLCQLCFASFFSFFG